ncbi:MAG: hypothetical protein VB012_03440 [Erysipelotrichaceae bacterium]|nr:hypothetical protein [Erysipelotrichaceae bacterium]
MGQKVTDFKAVANYSISYRFICEQCGYASQWKEYQFQHEEVMNLSGWNAKLSPEMNQQLNQKAQAGLQAKIENAKRAAEQHRYPFSDVCPRCHKHQSWGCKSLYAMIIIVPFFTALTSIVIFWLLSMLESTVALKVTGGATLLALLAAAVYVSWRKIQTNQCSVKHLPEINWNQSY